MVTDLELFINHLRISGVDLNGKLDEEYYYASLPLCVIDAVFSIGVNYSSTRNTVKKWCTFHEWPRLQNEAKDKEAKTIDQFLDLLEGKDAELLALHDFNNRQRTSTRNGIRKAEAVCQFAKVLQKFNIQRFGDTYDADMNQKAEALIKQIKGQKSGISFSYFLMLAGADDFVKSDRMLQRFTSEALNRKVIDPQEVQNLFTVASEQLKFDYPHMTPRLLDHLIWGHQRVQEKKLKVKKLWPQDGKSIGAE